MAQRVPSIVCVLSGEWQHTSNNSDVVVGYIVCIVRSALCVYCVVECCGVNSACV
jgi:hypothetical protein